MRALVAGGAGFVGSHLCERLCQDGHQVICLDNLSTGRWRHIAALAEHPVFTFIKHDVTQELPALPRFDWVFHLASPASPPAYQRRPVETLLTNSEGTRRLLELAARDGSRFLYTSTSEVYGDPLEHPQRESYRGNVSTTGPRSMYDEGKRYGEALTVAYAETRGVDVSIVRVFNTYGPRMEPDDGRVVSNFISQALRGEPLTIYGDGGQTRSFQYIDDLVEGILRAMVAGCRGPVNLGNPEEYTVIDLAQMVQELTEHRAGIVFRDLPGDDPRLRRPDITLAREMLRWEPKVPIREGLARTVAYFQERVASSQPARKEGAVYRSSQKPLAPGSLTSSR